jgi:hypothetical protein
VAADGSAGPGPYKVRRASTLYIRVPWAEWRNVSRGRKSEYRGSPGTNALKWVEFPVPVIAWTWHKNVGYETKLMVLEDCWQEPLAAISPESLAAEGFENLGEFRRHWMAREKRRFQPLKKATVFKVRPWREGLDNDLFKEKLFQHLYGEHLGDGA